MVLVSLEDVAASKPLPKRQQQPAAPAAQPSDGEQPEAAAGQPKRAAGMKRSSSGAIADRQAQRRRWAGPLPSPPGCLPPGAAAAACTLRCRHTPSLPHASHDAQGQQRQRGREHGGPDRVVVS